MKPWVKPFIAVVVVLAAVPLLISVYLEMREERDREAEMEKPVKEAPRVARTADREIVVRLDQEAQTRAALKAEPLTALKLSPESTAFGRLEEDPTGAFTLRAPASGTLRPAPGREWPALGEEVPGPGVVGLLAPRFAPPERADFASKIASAKAEIEARTVAASAARSSFDRIRILNAEGKSASDRALQEAEVRVREEEGRLKSATETVRILEGAIPPGSGEGEPLPLAIPQKGQVVEVLARPGESVESGQGILRIVRFDLMIARAAAPSGIRLEQPTPAARIVIPGYEDRPLPGVFFARGSGPGETLLFRIDAGGTSARPGMGFQAWIPAPGDAQEGVVIPRSSLVRFGGRVWAYVQVAETEFIRRELVEAKSVEQGWFVRRGFEPNQRVVTAGAQVLLSEELKSQIQVGEEEMRKG